jgi:uncharacterized protein (TIGR00251 family)
LDVLLDGLKLEDVDDGVRIRVRVSPGSRREAIVGLHGDRLKIAVTAPPERGRANQAVTDFLARILGSPRSAVRVVAGHTTRDKTLLVVGGVASTIRERLSRAR